MTFALTWAPRVPIPACRRLVRPNTVYMCFRYGGSVMMRSYTCVIAWASQARPSKSRWLDPAYFEDVSLFSVSVSFEPRRTAVGLQAAPWTPQRSWWWAERLCGKSDDEWQSRYPWRNQTTPCIEKCAPVHRLYLSIYRPTHQPGEEREEREGERAGEEGKSIRFVARDFATECWVLRVLFWDSEIRWVLSIRSIVSLSLVLFTLRMVGLFSGLNLPGSARLLVYWKVHRRVLLGLLSEFLGTTWISGGLLVFLRSVHLGLYLLLWGWIFDLGGLRVIGRGGLVSLRLWSL